MCLRTSLEEKLKKNILPFSVNNQVRMSTQGTPKYFTIKKLIYAVVVVVFAMHGRIIA